MDTNRLRNLRKEFKKSQQDVADYLGITRQGFGSYENGVTEPDHETLLKIADYFEVSTDYLLGRSIVRTPEEGMAFSDGGRNWTEEEMDMAEAIIEAMRKKQGK